MNNQIQNINYNQIRSWLENSSRELPQELISPELSSRPARFIRIKETGESISNEGGKIFFKGTLLAGTLHKNDGVLLLPSNRPSIIANILSSGKSLEAVSAPANIELQIEGDLKLTDGDMIVKINQPYPTYSSQFTLRLSWLSSEPAELDKTYIIRQTNDEVLAEIKQKKENGDEILVNIKTEKPLKFDSYVENPLTGGVIVLDRFNGKTIGIGAVERLPEVYSYNI